MKLKLIKCAVILSVININAPKWTIGGSFLVGWNSVMLQKKSLNKPNVSQKQLKEAKDNLKKAIKNINDIIDEDRVHELEPIYDNFCNIGQSLTAMRMMHTRAASLASPDWKTYYNYDNAGKYAYLDTVLDQLDDMLREESRTLSAFIKGFAVDTSLLFDIKESFYIGPTFAFKWFTGSYSEKERHTADWEITQLFSGAGVVGGYKLNDKISFSASLLAGGVHRFCKSNRFNYLNIKSTLTFALSPSAQLDYHVLPWMHVYWRVGAIFAFDGEPDGLSYYHIKSDSFFGEIGLTFIV